MRGRKDNPESSVSRGTISFLLALGFCLIITAVIGCVGALRENTKVLYIHACFFIFLVSLELIVTVGAAVLSAWVGTGGELRANFFTNTTIQEDVVKHNAYWDQLQTENECCGVDGPQDYSILNRDIPSSCCARAHTLREGGARKQLHATCLSERTYYVRGCEESLRKKKAIKGNIFVTFGAVFGLIELTCIVLAIWMARTIKLERRKLQQNLQAHFET
ncbi:Tetraspanin-14 [Eumeta japonica]|uniref:Tetraspanin n=1 Tax=Eumeta variegata TaxID=151549 RepID=A0A4C1Y0I3_EUMVA|nr:Tetraspanin-14 [Eumeta japonica]